MAVRKVQSRLQRLPSLHKFARSKHKRRFRIAISKSDDTALINYRGTLAEGSVFAGSEGRDPLQFKLGPGTVIARLDDGVNGMVVGEKKRVELP